MAFFEKNLPPDTYEKLTDAYAKGERPGPQNAEIKALRSELSELKEMLKQGQEQVQQQSNVAWISDYMREVDHIISDPKFNPIRDFSNEYEKLTGERVNIHASVAKEYDDFEAMYQKRLTPIEVCEILLERAEERLESYKPQATEETKPVEDKKKTKKFQPESGKTLTNATETQSSPKMSDEIPFEGDHDKYLEAVADKFKDSLWQGRSED
jgi:hypothetical protein